MLGNHARNHLNKVVFYVFNPSLVAANLAKTVTFESFLTLWFMPVNILITFLIGSALGWLLVKVTKPSKRLKGLIIGPCSVALGLFLALKRINIMGETATHHMNKAVFFVFGPALGCVTIAKTVTFRSFLPLWFMIVNIFLTYLLGSALGWVLNKVTKKTPRHVKGLVLASCSAGNLGLLPYIILPAMCKQKNSPFGAPDVCERYGLVYASLSMAIGSIIFWLYTYNIVRVTSKGVTHNLGVNGETLAANVPEAEPALHSPDNAVESSSLANNSTKSSMVI